FSYEVRSSPRTGLRMLTGGVKSWTRVRVRYTRQALHIASSAKTYGSAARKSTTSWRRSVRDIINARSSKLAGTHDPDTDAHEQHAGPSHPVHTLAEEQGRARGTHDVVQGGGGNHEAEIRPRQQRQQREEGQRLERNAHPHRRRPEAALQ